MGCSLGLFKKLSNQLNYLDTNEVDSIYQAFLLAEDAHRQQRRSTGEPYITHPVAVATILAQIKMDADTIKAALLHDVIEDTFVVKSTIIEHFGQDVAEMVDGVSKLSKLEFISKAHAQAENLRKMVMAMSRDIRVIIVKLADRLHNMRTLGSLRSIKRRRIAKETLEIFAPIAKRLGMRDFSVELEELGFQARSPMRYRILKDAVRRIRGDRKKILSMIEKALIKGINESGIVPDQVFGREKHLYSIYRKMQHKSIPFGEVMDVYAFRIIVKDIDSCYRSLGVAHRLFKPVPERFKDYIAIPKANGYQSLHTTLFGPYGLPIEVQIRTVEMDHLATSGIAAHWLYKSDGSSVSSTRLLAEKWVKDLLELQQRSSDSLEFIESVKVDLFPDEIYVFTPGGKIMELPSGSTAVDFAYSVHTDIGNSCVAAKVNRQLCPLSTSLSNGEVVEIVTSVGARPNPAWLDFVVTSKARSGIRHFLKNQRRAESVSLGKELLKKSLVQFGVKHKEIPKVIQDKLLAQLSLDHWDDLLAEIGLANRAAMIDAQLVASLIASHKDGATGDGKSECSDQPLLIKGTEGMALRFSKCCCPIPGDPIIGKINVGKGIEVHNAECSRVLNMRSNPENFIALRWAASAQGQFETAIKLDVVDELGVLAMITLSIAESKSSIVDIKIDSRDGKQMVMRFVIMVSDRKHLSIVIRRLRQLRSVNKINRD